MRVPIRSLSVLACTVAVLLAASAATAQIEDQVGEYMDTNGEAYLQPLADAIGASLNGGIWHTAFIPEEGFYVSFETHLLAVYFDDDQRTFTYTPMPGDNEPIDTASLETPTVVGDPAGVVIETESLPYIATVPGFNMNSFALAVPQLRIGAYMGTEATIRYIAIDAGDTEIGNMKLMGFGARHSVTQWLGADFPVDIAAGFFWQNFELGEGLIDATAMTFGAMAGKEIQSGFAIIEPYFGLSYDTFKMDVSYDYEEDDQQTTAIDLEMESDASIRATIGLHVSAGFLDLNGEYNFGNMNGFAAGVGFKFQS